MRRDFLIAIILAIAAFPAGVALMVAPQYLHLTGIAVPLAFWGGLILFLLLVGLAAFVALRGEAKAIQERKMTGAVIGYNAALVAALAATLAAIKRWPRTAVIACIIAWLGIGIDYLLGPPRGWLFAGLFTGEAETPYRVHLSIDWTPFLPRVASGKKDGRYHLLEVIGLNESNTEIVIEDAYFVSGITGAQASIKVQLPDQTLELGEINPIPPRAFITLVTALNPPDGLSSEEFLEGWGPFSLVVRYHGKEPERLDVTREQTIDLLTPANPAFSAYPHVTPKKGTDH
jgi:hypothetical protein